MQLTPSSVLPYTSNSESSGKRARYCCLSVELHGAALAISRRIDDTSNAVVPGSGRLQIMRIGVGALNVVVTR